MGAARAGVAMTATVIGVAGLKRYVDGPRQIDFTGGVSVLLAGLMLIVAPSATGPLVAISTGVGTFCAGTWP